MAQLAIDSVAPMELSNELAATLIQVIPVFVAALVVGLSFHTKRMTELERTQRQATLKYQEEAAQAYRNGLRGRKWMLHYVNAEEAAMQEAFPDGRTPLTGVLATSLQALTYLLFMTLQIAAFTLCLLVLMGVSVGQVGLIVPIAGLAGIVALGLLPVMGSLVPGSPREMWRESVLSFQLARMASTADRDAQKELDDQQRSGSRGRWPGVG